MFLIKRYTAFALIVFYIVGVFGVLMPLHPQFILLTPLNLLFSVAMMLLHHPNANRRFWLSLSGCYLAGWCIELLGVQTGLLFGEYSYGGTLGPKIWGTPLIIGLNWAMLIYAVSAIAYRHIPNTPLLLRAAVGASLMVFLDLWIEPVAVHYDFWTWQEPPTNRFLVAPFQNYAFWWLAAFVLITFFQFYNKLFINKIAELLFVLQLIFFVVIFLSSLVV